MTYGESLDFIHAIARFGSKPGLRRVRMLLERMGNPQNRLKFIHVAGTNGKGSTCTMLSHILVEAGYRTGLYISPFVLDFRERIQLNNEMIPPEALADCTAAVKAHWDALDAIGEPPTEFEVVVAVAMEYFVRSGCEVVVLEVGMGGRFDATNIIETPLCSVITSISRDHTEYLGDTIEKIAAEKCGIIKPGGVCVSYPLQDPAALAVIMETCAEKGNRLLLPNAAAAEILEQTIDGSRIRCGDLDLSVPLAGTHQIYNVLTVLEAVKAISFAGIIADNEAVSRGIANTSFPARLEVLCRGPLVLLDGAHNASGAKALGAALALLGGRPVHAVIGVMADKEAELMLRSLAPHLASLTATTPDNPRALGAEALADKARRLCADVRVEPNPRSAVESAFARCGPDDALLLCGSLYLASDVRAVALELSNKV